MKDLPLSLLSLIVLLFVAAELSFTGYAGLKIAKRHPGDIRIVCYVLSLAISLTGAIILWAKSVGGLDSNGTFQGPIGNAINHLLAFMLDLNTDVKILGTLALIIIGPQLTSYGLAGLFGCAAPPKLVGPTVTFLVWSLVKSMVIAAGILMVIATFGWLLSWSGWGLRGVTGMSMLAVTLLFMALFLLSIYREINDDLDKDSPLLTGRRGAFIQHIKDVKMWLTRNVH